MMTDYTAFFVVFTFAAFLLASLLLHLVAQ
jgi:hypothetical protein